MEKPIKPLGGKAYGHIGHLPSSRLGTGDHHVHEGQAEICTNKPRNGDRIIVQEKLDGANMSVANIAGFILPLTRAGYHARDASYEHLRFFETYVREREPTFAKLLPNPGDRVAGEWLALAHGTRYDTTFPFFSPFVVFDIIRDGERVLYDEFKQRTTAAGLRRAAKIYDGTAGMSVLDAMTILDTSFAHTSTCKWFGLHGAMEGVEGAVWRVEREGRVDFLAKYVRSGKIDGKYLPEVSGGEPIWYWRPKDQPANDNHTQIGSDHTQNGKAA